MELKINNLDDLRGHLSTFLTKDELKYTIEIIEDEFMCGLAWAVTRRFPQSIVKHCLEEGDGIYNLTNNNVQYRITIKDAIPTVEVARRTQSGVAVCPGWFGRIKKSMRMHGWRYNDRVGDKLFSTINQYTRYLKSQ